LEDVVDVVTEKEKGPASPSGKQSRFFEGALAQVCRTSSARQPQARKVACNSERLPWQGNGKTARALEADTMKEIILPATVNTSPRICSTAAINPLDALSKRCTFLATELNRLGRNFYLEIKEGFY